MASRATMVMLAAGALLSGAAGFAAVTDTDGRLTRVYDPRAVPLHELSEKLSAQERSLARQTESIEAREKALRAEEARLAERVAELEKLRAEIGALRAQVDEEHAARVAAVVKTVEAMKPAAASPMIQKLDLQLATEVLQQMSNVKAGKLMAALPPALAARITEGLAGPGGPVGASEVAPLPEPAPAPVAPPTAAPPADAAPPAANAPADGSNAATPPAGGQ